MRSKFNLIIVFGLLGMMVLSACAPEPTPSEKPAPAELILATTTSTQDSGLLEYLLPDFEKEYNVFMKVIAVGSGQAIQMGKDGNADVLLVHSPTAEKTYMEEKHGVRREDVMYNDFIIVGPEEDPAKIKNSATAVDAFKALMNSKSKFVSRGDDSGTHSKEKAIWKAAELEPSGNWYISAGQGMGAVLTMADEEKAYTLADRATYMTQVEKGLELQIMIEGDNQLLNPYGVIAVDPSKSPKINNEVANQFIDWLISDETQKKIADFKKEELGVSLFIPNYKK